MRVPPLLLAVAVAGVAHATTERPCDVEGVAVTRGSTKYVVGRPHQPGAIFATCGADGSATCFEDRGLADAPSWAYPRIPCDARIIHGRRRKLGVAINLKEDKWPNGLVFYRFSDKYPLADHERDMVRQAIKMYEATDLGVAFQECEPKSLCKNMYVDICQKEDACYSYVGFTGEGGGQIMNLGKSCFEEPGTAVHEFGHALGLYHEHTHPFREVIVLTDGDLPVSASNYAKETDALLKPYDKGSIMHYGRSAGLCLPKDQYPLDSFCDVEVTTNCVMPKKTHCNNSRNHEFGQRTALSPGDLNTLKSIYGTQKPTLKPTTAPTPSSPEPSSSPSPPPSSSAPAPSSSPPAPSSSAPAPTTQGPTPSPSPSATQTPEPPATTKKPDETSAPTSKPSSEPPSPPPSTTAPAPPTTTTPPSPSSTTPQPSTTAPTPTKSPLPPTTAPTATTAAPTPTTTAPTPITTAPVATTVPAPITTAPSVTTRAPALTNPPSSSPTAAPTTAPTPITQAPSSPSQTSRPVATTAVPTTTTQRPSPLTTAPETYRPGNVIPDPNTAAWWDWYNKNKNNKKWADIQNPAYSGGVKWWMTWSDTQSDVASDSDGKNHRQPNTPANNKPMGPTGWSFNNMPMGPGWNPPRQQPTPNQPKNSYSFRGWWGR